MKKIFLLYTLIAMTLTVFAQKEINNPSKKLQIKNTDSDIKEMDIAGMKVILKPSTKDIISVAVYIQGGTRNYTEKEAGIEQLALSWVSQGGTTKRNKDEFNNLANKIGARIGVGATQDFANMNMTCIKSQWNDSWSLFSDMILNPSFDAATFDIVKEQMIAGVKNQESDPDSHLEDMLLSQVYKNTPYAYSSQGTEQSLTALTADQVKQYYKSLLNKKRMYAVVVGNVSEADVKTKLAALGIISASAPPALSAVKQVNISNSSIHVEERELATNYMMGAINAPLPNSKDFNVYRIAFRILGDRYFDEIRTKRNLSYAPSAFFARSNYESPTARIYVTSTDPTQCAQVMIDELNKIRKDGFTEKELKDMKESFLTSYFMNLETNSSQNDMLGSYQAMANWQASIQYANDVKNLTIDNLNEVFRKYVNGIQWVYLGDKSKVDEKVFLTPLK